VGREKKKIRKNSWVAIYREERKEEEGGDGMGKREMGRNS
jgi:hypothetical protein